MSAELLREAATAMRERGDEFHDAVAQFLSTEAAHADRAGVDWNDPDTTSRHARTIARAYLPADRHVTWIPARAGMTDVRRRELEDTLTGRVCTDPACTIPRKPGRPMHGPHDFTANREAPR